MEIKNVLIHFLALIAIVCGTMWGIIEISSFYIIQDPVQWLFLIPLVGGIIGAIVNYNIMKED